MSNVDNSMQNNSLLVAKGEKAVNNAKKILNQIQETVNKFKID